MSIMNASIAATSSMAGWDSRPIRPRKRGACTNCRLRKTRCDAIGSAMPRAPCTNCAAFSLPCSTSTGQLEMIAGPESGGRDNDLNKLIQEQAKTGSALHPMQLLEDHFTHDVDKTDLYVQFLNPDVRNAPIHEPGRIAYLGESSNLPLLVENEAGVVHFQLPELFGDSRSKVAKMDNIEIDLLRQKGALSLPPWRMCDILVEAYFKWVAPGLPIINKSRFMRQYGDANNPPSMLLLQAIFLAGSTVTRTGTAITSKQLYKRAKALYDSGYEDNRIVIVQTLLLIAWYWEQSEGHVEDVLYWNGVATTVALGSGIHRSAERSPFSITDKRLWRRIWWTLFIRDRSTALLGQVVQIHTDDSDMEMVCEDDFIDPEHPPDPLHVQFFLQCVKLCVIVDAILPAREAATPWPEFHRTNAVAQFELLLSEWLNARPKELKWEERNNVWSNSLRCRYLAVLPLLHGQHSRALYMGSI